MLRKYANLIISNLQLPRAINPDICPIRNLWFRQFLREAMTANLCRQSYGLPITEYFEICCEIRPSYRWKNSVAALEECNQIRLMRVCFSHQRQAILKSSLYLCLPMAEDICPRRRFFKYSASMRNWMRWENERAGAVKINHSWVAVVIVIAKERLL